MTNPEPHPASQPTMPNPESHLPLPPPFSSPNHTSPPPVLISQGAEALLLRTPFLSSPLAALKYRPPKPYRHATLDARLTRARILAEARLLLKCARAGVAVPAVLGLAADEGWLALGWVRGGTVKARLREIRGHEDGEEEACRVLGMVGRAVARLHAAGVVHGDLTSSNMMLAPREDGEEEEELVLIDFGLAAQSAADEDRAVDLYVLERALGSTHPELEGRFAHEVLGPYERSFKGGRAVVKRLEEVRMRGRKKSMLG